MTAHWHVATGIAGYGPDAADDNFDTLTSIREVAESVRYELDACADIAHDAAVAFADAGDFEQAWSEHVRSEDLGTRSLNLDAKREGAPLYVGNPGLWEETLQRLTGECSGMDVTPSVRLYVWECTEDCEA